ncbi:MAG: hypothetical protein ACREFL_01895 [Stellaceae bacterium]
MLDKPAPHGPVAMRAATPFVPAAGLGAALAALPKPWIVFRKGGFSSFEQPGEIYGGLYIALHPQKGVVLADTVPAQPELAIPRLRALLRQSGLPAFAEDEPPIAALALTRADLPSLAARLNGAFPAPCRIADPSWTETAFKALAMRFPYLRPVQRVDGGALSLESVAEVAARPSTAAVPVPVASWVAGNAVPERLLVRSPRTYSRRADAPPANRAGRLALGGAAIAAVALAGVALMPRYAGDLVGGRTAETPQSTARIIPPPAPSPSPVPETAAISPITDGAFPAAQTAPDARELDAAVPAEKPAAPSKATPARTAKHKETARPMKTAEREPAAASIQTEAKAGAEAAEQKPKKTARAAALAARPERARRSVELGPPALDNTVTVDGLTYIKGREPRSLDSLSSLGDSTTVPVTDSSAALAAPASGAPAAAALSVGSQPAP